MPSLSPSRLTALRRAFVDVCRGYSVATYQSRPVYVKHLSHQEHCDFEDLQSQFHDEAVSKGATPEADRLTYLVAQGRWSLDKEDEIARQRDTIVRFIEGRKQFVNLSLIRQHEEQTKGEQKKLNDLLVARAEAMGVTAEVYAQQRINDHYILRNLFTTKDFTIPVLSEDTFEDLSDSEVSDIVSLYNQATDGCSETSLKQLAVQDFFFSYFSLCNDHLSDFYGRPVAEMTYYQIRLGNAARYFKSLVENCDMSKIAPSDRNDPDVIERTFTSQRNTAQAKAEGRTPNVGMTKEDIAAQGLENQMAKLPKQNMDMNAFLTHMRKHQPAGQG